MAFEFTDMTKHLARAAAIAVIGFSASACSMVPDWMGGSSDSSATADDQADQQAGANASAPDLASVPDKPVAPSTADDQKALADSLGTDRAQNQYSSDALRGGTEAAAAPPGAPPPPDKVASTSAPSQPAPDASDTAAPADAGSIDAASAANAPPPAPAPAAQPASSRVAAAPAPAVAPSAGGAAVPEGSYRTYGMSGSAVSPSDAALGFKPSMAPPLSPSIGQFVARPIITRYQQTAQMSRSAYSVSSQSGYSAAPVSNNARGASVADLNSVPPSAMSGYSDGGAPSAVVAFSGDRTILNAEAKAQVHAAAAAFMQGGGQGFVRVVGHSASAGSLSSERHMALNFEHSQARATAVARELIKDGVPADKVLVQTAGGEDTSATAEIFLQS